MIANNIQRANEKPADKLFVALASVYFYFVIALPTGSIFGVNVKALVFIPLFLLVLTRVTSRNPNPYWSLSYLLGIPTLLSLWVFLSQNEGYDFLLASLQYRNLLLTIAGCWFASVLVERDQGKRIKFLRLIVWSIASLSILKMLMLAYSAEKGIPVSDLVDGISNAFGVKLMTFDFDDSGGILGRVEFTSDNVVPLCCFAIVCLRRELNFNRLVAIAVLLLLLVSAALSFSRFIWIFSALSICLGISVAKRDKTFAVILISCVVAAVCSIKEVLTLIALRFSDAVVGSSDSPRHDQIVSLNQFFLNAPLLGHGFGTHPHEVIRSALLPYSYEVELLALAGQVGVIGLLLLAALLVWYFWTIMPFRKSYSWYKFATLILLLTFIGGGLTNPMLLTSVSSVSFALLKVLGSVRDSS